MDREEEINQVLVWLSRILYPEKGEFYQVLFIRDLECIDGMFVKMQFKSREFTASNANLTNPLINEVAICLRLTGNDFAGGTITSSTVGYNPSLVRVDIFKPTAHEKVFAYEELEKWIKDKKLEKQQP